MCRNINNNYIYLERIIVAVVIIVESSETTYIYFKIVPCSYLCTINQEQQTSKLTKTTRANVPYAVHMKTVDQLIKMSSKSNDRKRLTPPT